MRICKVIPIRLYLQFFSTSLNMSIKIIVFLLLSIVKTQAFTTSQLEVVKSLSDQFIRRQILIVKNVKKETEKYNLVETTKYFSKFQIYTSFRSVKEMHANLYELVTSNWPTYKYHPKTMALVDNNTLSDVAKSYFNVSFKKKVILIFKIGSRHRT